MQIGTAERSRRHHFRLETARTPCAFFVADGPSIVGKAGDIGGGGLLLVCPVQPQALPMRASGQVHFALLGENFELPARLVRRVETLDRCELALAWPDAPPQEVDRLMYCLFRMEVSRRGPPVPAAPRPESPRRARRSNRDWLLVAGLGVAGGALLPPAYPVLPTLIVVVLLAVWLIIGAR